MKIEMHHRESIDELLNDRIAGDYIFAIRSDGSKTPIIVCPRCLKPGFCSAHTIIKEQPLTIRASFLCNQFLKDKQICGWHGWITDGFMEGDEV